MANPNIYSDSDYENRIAFANKWRELIQDARLREDGRGEGYQLFLAGVSASDMPFRPIRHTVTGYHRHTFEPVLLKDGYDSPAITAEELMRYDSKDEVMMELRGFGRLGQDEHSTYVQDDAEQIDLMKLLEGEQ